ncbi:reactive intermediate/imine deaminase [Breoghania corrubedonensis]|uniref:Reactive intermediate/imine deaminase n=1 Tax=Breoghania corrubedonensis TaxID=665038 RepID=A0A2T5VFP5_9HYPH|nr:RidA family protein [Breoghania corrubedonensis]PTW62569.1 reactive intermediate/imine deaminase [Breoghania corrubedonensis]
MKKQTFGVHPVVPLSAAVRAGDYIHLSGQVPFTADGMLVVGDIEVQTRQVLDNIAAVLKQAGAALDDVVKTTIWLSDPTDFQRFNAVYGEYFAQNPPARSCVAGRLMVNAKVEVEALAYKPLA